MSAIKSSWHVSNVGELTGTDCYTASWMERWKWARRATSGWGGGDGGSKDKKFMLTRKQRNVMEKRIKMVLHRALCKFNRNQLCNIGRVVAIIVQKCTVKYSYFA